MNENQYLERSPQTGPNFAYAVPSQLAWLDFLNSEDIDANTAMKVH
jgi:hypothetical protein